MKLETYAKIGIITGIAIATLVGINLTIMVLNHEFGYDFRDMRYGLSGNERQEILDSFSELPEYIAFMERYPDSSVQTRASERDVRMEITKYDPTTQNGLRLEISQHGFDDHVYTEANCDSFKRNSGIREHAREGMTLDYIKTTPCVESVQ